MAIISYFACDRCGTDRHDEKFTQIRLSLESGPESVLHLCVPCLAFLKGEIKPLAIADARKGKRFGRTK